MAPRAAAFLYDFHIKSLVINYADIATIWMEVG